jgi:CTP:molybdopterin cytidylyltransferase MocA
VTDVDVAILHLEPNAEAGPLTRATHVARLDLAERHRRGFLAAGATRVTLHAGPRDDVPFGARLRHLAADIGDGGLIVLGSGAIPLATAVDRRELIAAARQRAPAALANNRYSADVIAISRARSVLARVPDLATDNMLPRWLAEGAGVPVSDVRSRRRLGVDIDGPLDLVLLAGRWLAHLDPSDARRAVAAIDAVRRVATDPDAELLIAGRVSASNLAWLERETASRTRALVEERGLRTRRPGQRSATSVMGALLERDGPESFGEHVARLGDAAIIDTRVVIAHRFGADEAGWPPTEDRFASDLLLTDHIADPWLRALTTSAAAAPVPILLGGHTLVGPGLALALRPGR